MKEHETLQEYKTVDQGYVIEPPGLNATHAAIFTRLSISTETHEIRIQDKRYLFAAWPPVVPS